MNWQRTGAARPPRDRQIMAWMPPNARDYEPCGCGGDCAIELVAYRLLVQWEPDESQFVDSTNRQPLIGQFTHWADLGAPPDDVPRIGYSETMAALEAPDKIAA